MKFGVFPVKILGKQQKKTFTTWQNFFGGANTPFDLRSVAETLKKNLFSIVDNLVLMLPAPTISFGIESVNNCYEKVSIKEIQLDKVIKPL